MILEIFSCSGALAEGFRQAGLPVDMAFDRDPDACDSYEKNLGTRPVQLDVRDLLRMARAGWSPGPIDLLLADPPCTPWSRAGKMRGLADERDVLRETAELIALLRPRAYLIGNIPGLQDANALHVVQDVIGGLARFGYCVTDFCTLDAADFGVPQRRVRPFWFGHCGGGAYPLARAHARRPGGSRAPDPPRRRASPPLGDLSRGPRRAARGAARPAGEHRPQGQRAGAAEARAGLAHGRP